jgi:hypothetical protein
MTMQLEPKRTNSVLTGLTDCTEAAALGVLCAGLLLWSQQINLSLIGVHSHRLAKLIFLVIVGGAFGLSAALILALSRIVAEFRKKL